nr:MAG TPA: hypothetical protein [Caudoviricetes sp.]
MTEQEIEEQVIDPLRGAIECCLQELLAANEEAIRAKTLSHRGALLKAASVTREAATAAGSSATSLSLAVDRYLRRLGET